MDKKKLKPFEGPLHPRSDWKGQALPPDNPKSPEEAPEEEPEEAPEEEPEEEEKPEE